MREFYIGRKKVRFIVTLKHVAKVERMVGRFI